MSSAMGRSFRWINPSMVTESLLEVNLKRGIPMSKKFDEEVPHLSGFINDFRNKGILDQ